MERKKKKNDFVEKSKNVIENVQYNKVFQTLYWGTLTIGFLYTAASIYKLSAVLSAMKEYGHNSSWVYPKGDLINRLLLQNPMTTSEIESLRTMYLVFFAAFSVAIATSLIIYFNQRLAGKSQEEFGEVNNKFLSDASIERLIDEDDEIILDDQDNLLDARLAQM